MLVYWMFLDEHVNHEPQTMMYLQHSLALQKEELPRSYWVRRFQIGSVSLFLFLSVSPTVREQYAWCTTSEGGGTHLEEQNCCSAKCKSKLQFYSLYFIVHLRMDCFAVKFRFQCQFASLHNRDKCMKNTVLFLLLLFAFSAYQVRRREIVEQLLLRRLSYSCLE